jgi:c-di-GMP-binding flagellar brake protein YcgR
MFNYGASNDRRRFQRLAMNLCVNYRVIKPVELRIKFGDEEVEAEMLDISSGGMAIMTEHNIPPLSVLHFKFSLFKIDKTSGSAVFYRPLEIRGQVRSNMRMETGHRLGICFHRYDREMSQEVKAIAKEVTVN